mmetsp:Transcript_8108/g.13983  ORF Transcript_8108/g.13983 Transcript_8108/m.13983 type:complete len:88 (+) Transcript_8108:462-725(+)
MLLQQRILAKTPTTQHAHNKTTTVPATKAIISSVENDKESIFCSQCLPKTKTKQKEKIQMQQWNMAKIKRCFQKLIKPNSGYYFSNV